MDATTPRETGGNSFSRRRRSAGLMLGQIIFCLVFFWPPFLYAEETYTFDLSEIEKKPGHFGGYLEAKPILSRPSGDSAVYRLKYAERDLGGSLEEANLKVQITGSYEKEMVHLYFKTNTDYRLSRLGDQERTDLFEGCLSLNPSSSWKIDAGKRPSNGERAMPGIR
jgi:hypothetical protein